MTNLLFKLNSIVSSGTVLGLSSLAADGDINSTVEITSIGGVLLKTIINGLVAFIDKLIYMICSFILNVIEMIEFIISSMLGITISLDDYVILDTRNPLVKLLTNETVLRVFRIVMGVAIVLIIIFTIFAIVRSEYENAIDPDEEVHSKGRVFGRTLRSFFILGMFPLFMLVGIILVNAILAGFNNILRGGDNSTIAGQIFITSGYNANQFRRYADNDVRIPILINFEDPIYLGQENAYKTEELVKIYDNFHETGKRLYNGFADNDFDSFGNTVVYRNNRIYNQDSYNGFEHFICTREQYYVMADFIDYALKHNLTYYVKSMKDPDITWKYVSDQIYDAENQTLKITYTDASNLNDGESYTVQYTPSSIDISTPISDAMQTIQALLAIGKFSSNTFNLLKRVENSINVVEWETDRVYLGLSNQFKAVVNSSNPTQNALRNAMTITDKLILFEYARYEYNNSIDCTFEELLDGYTLPVQRLAKKRYQPSTQSFVQYDEYYVVQINGTYYQVEINEDLKDGSGELIRDVFGDPYYTIVESNFGPEMSPSAATGFNDNDIIDLGTYYNKNGRTISLGKMAFIKEGLNKSYSDIIALFQDGTVTDDAGNSTIYADEVSQCIKQVSWPQKLISDLQVIYKDININDFITKNKWLTALGEYFSAQQKNELSANISTSLIHPLGLILSELFLGDVKESDGFNLYSDLQFSSRFDESTIKALMLSLCGEENYFQLKAQFEYFNEMYNAFMGPVIDEIAFNNNIQLVNGSEGTVDLFTYKAYLASMLISSSAADWFYKTAMSMLGSFDFEEDIIDTATGNYLSYDDLVKKDDSYRDILANILRVNNEALQADGVYRGDDSYPEYLNALYDYIYGDNSWFEGRLDNILSSWDPIGNRNYRQYVAYKRVVETYKDFVRELENGGYQQDIIDIFKSNMVIPDTNFALLDDAQLRNMEGDGHYSERLALSFANANDDFALITNETGINNLKTTALGYVERAQRALELASKAGIDDETNAKVMDKLNIHITAITDFVAARKNYYEQDFTYQNNGKMQELVDGRNDAAELIDKLFDDDLGGRIISGEGYVKCDLLKEIDRRLSEHYKSLHPGSSLEIGLEMASTDKILIISDLFDSDTLELIYEGFDDDIYKGEAWQGLVDRMLATCDMIDWLLNEGDAVYDICAATNDNWSSLDQTGKRQEANKVHSALVQYAQAIRDYFDYQTKIDQLNRYYITYSVSVGTSQNDSITLDIVVNNKHYTVGQNFTSSKFIEYVLGGEFLTAKGIGTAFVDEDYKGLLDYTRDGNNFVFGVPSGETDIYGNTIYKNVESFSLLQKFLVEVGEISKDLYQMTNLTNLSHNTHDEIVIGATSASEKDLARVMLEMIVGGDENTGDYVPYDLLMGFFGITNEQISTYTSSFPSLSRPTVEEAVKQLATLKIQSSNYEQNNKYLNTALGYLLLTDTKEDKTNYVDYSKLTLKDIRTRCMSLLVNYEKQDGETVAQNQMRYMALLALCCSDWGTIDQSNIADSYVGAINNSWSAARRNNISVLLSDRFTQATIRRLAGLKDRPATDIVGAEYTIDFNTKGVDEANGDIFVICTFDSETKKFVPFMMSNHRGAGDFGMATDEDGNSWLDKYSFINSYTDYYAFEDDPGKDVYFPIIAKGYITEEGYPTAIRENEGRIECYRNDIIVHDVSNTGLEAYYATMDQITVNHTGLSYFVNMFTKMISGKSLVERLIEAFPRFAAHSDLNFCYGTDLRVVDSRDGGKALVNFNFSDGISPKMELLYSLGNMNIIALIIGTVTILIALWKALWGLTGRMFDVTVYFLLGPAVISTLPLRSDARDKDKNVQESSDDMYARWKDGIIGKIVNVFSYAVGFNIFFIVVPIISSMTLFTSNAAFASLPVLGSVSPSFLNEVARLVFLIAAAYLSTSAPALFAKITKTSNAFEEADTTIKNVKDTVNSVKDVWSGQAALDAVGEMKDTFVNMIPGSAIAQRVKDDIQKVAIKTAAKVAEAAAVAHGVPPEVAKKAANQLAESLQTQQALKRTYNNKKKAERQARIEERLTGKPNKDLEDVAKEAGAQYKQVAKSAAAVRERRKQEKKAEKKSKKNAGMDTSVAQQQNAQQRRAASEVQEAPQNAAEQTQETPVQEAPIEAAANNEAPASAQNEGAEREQNNEAPENATEESSPGVVSNEADGENEAGGEQSSQNGEETTISEDLDNAMDDAMDEATDEDGNVNMARAVRSVFSKTAGQALRHPIKTAKKVGAEAKKGIRKAKDNIREMLPKKKKKWDDGIPDVPIPDAVYDYVSSDGVRDVPKTSMPNQPGRGAAPARQEANANAEAKPATQTRAGAQTPAETPAETQTTAQTETAGVQAETPTAVQAETPSNEGAATQNAPAAPAEDSAFAQAAIGANDHAAQVEGFAGSVGQSMKADPEFGDEVAAFGAFHAANFGAAEGGAEGGTQSGDLGSLYGQQMQQNSTAYQQFQEQKGTMSSYADVDEETQGRYQSFLQQSGQADSLAQRTAFYLQDEKALSGDTDKSQQFASRVEKARQAALSAQEGASNGGTAIQQERQINAARKRNSDYASQNQDAYQQYLKSHNLADDEKSKMSFYLYHQKKEK